MTPKENSEMKAGKEVGFDWRPLRRPFGCGSLISDMYDLSGGMLYYVPPVFAYPSTLEAWQQDWNNIGSDFWSAATRLEREYAT